MPNKPKRFKCPQCGTRMKLHSHIGILPWWECPHCRRDFSPNQLSDWQKHYIARSLNPDNGLHLIPRMEGKKAAVEFFNQYFSPPADNAADKNTEV